MKHLNHLLTSWLLPYRYRRTRTVRYAFPALVIVGALLGAAVLTADTSSQILIESTASSVRFGEPFSVDVFVDAHTPVNAIDIAVALPAEYVTVGGIDIGESVITLWTQDPYVEDGYAYFRGGTFRKGFVGKHRIGTINLVANETGLATFAVDEVMLLAGDGSGSSVEVSTEDQSKKVYIAAADGSFTEEAASLEGDVRMIIITDIDGDGGVTLSDVSRFMSAWNDKTLIYDFDGDRKMTFRDFAIILADSFFKR